MPSPFPGMDPFVESQAWEDFHPAFAVHLREILVPTVVPRYVVRVEERVYVEHTPDQRPARILPDLTVLERERACEPVPAGGTRAAVTLEPVTLTVPMPERVREVYLTVRERESMEVVTVIEVLSPTNKRRGSDGRREYLRKRALVLASDAHLVEIDLLRGGERLPTNEPLPPGDYFALVGRQDRRPRTDVYAWPLRHPLPVIPVPLAGRDQDVPLDLQAAFTTVYDRAFYQYLLDYTRPVDPPLGDVDAAWVAEVLQAPAAAGLEIPR